MKSFLLKHLIYAVLIANMLLLFCYEGKACICSESLPSCAAYWKADAVFVGTVIEIDDSQGGIHKAKFALEHSYRGVEGKEVEIVSARHSCGYRFTKGGKYFVYASKSEDNILFTGACSRTHLFTNDDYNDDVKYAETVGDKTEKSIVVFVPKLYRTNLKKIKVVVEGENARYLPSVNIEVNYKIKIRKSGKYKVRIFLPLAAGLGGIGEQINKISKHKVTKRHRILDYDVELLEGQCVFISVPAF